MEFGIDALLDNQFKPVEGVTTTSEEESTDTTDAPEPKVEELETNTDTSTDDTSTTETTDDADESNYIALLKSEVGTEFGIELEEDFDQNYEGLSSLTKSIAAKAKEVGGKEAFERLFSDFPDMEDYLDYRLAGGDPAKYHEVAAATIDETTAPDFEDDKVAKQVITNYLKEVKGETDEDIKEMLEYLDDNGKLSTKAEQFFDKHKQVKEVAKTKLIEDQRKEAEKAVEANNKYWSDVETLVVKTGKVGKDGNVVIPATDRKGFFEYLAIPDKTTGNSKFNNEWAAMSEAEKLAFKYMIYKKGDVSALAARKNETSKVDKVLSSLRPGSKMTGGKEAPATASKINVQSDGLKDLFS